MSNKKKILVSLIITLMLLTITIVSNAASDGVITGETVKLREEPSMDGSLVTLLSVDNKVEVLGKDGEWYHIKYEDYEGYVYQDYVDVEGEVENETNDTNSTSNTSSENEVSENNTTSNETTTNTTSESEETQPEESQNEQSNEDIIGEEKIISENVELKILPLINSDVLGNIKKNATVTVQDEVNDWLYVYTDDLAGWIRKDKLSDKKTSNSSKNEDQESSDNKDESYTAYVDASSVNVRERASSNSDVVTTLSTNEKVTVESVENGWASVTTEDGTKGYISNEYLSKEEVKVTNRSADVERPTLSNQTSTQTSTKSEKSSSKSSSNTTKSDTTAKSDEKTTSSSSSSSKGTQVVSYAKKYLGASYVYGGDGPNSFDCSGFTQYVYKKFDVSLPHSASGQQSYGKAVSKSNLKQGDLVFFTGHVGIYVGNNKFIHAANPSKGVVITSLSNSYYKKNYITARRIF